MNVQFGYKLTCRRERTCAGSNCALVARTAASSVHVRLCTYSELAGLFSSSLRHNATKSLRYKVKQSLIYYTSKFGERINEFSYMCKEMTDWSSVMRWCTKSPCASSR